MELSRRVFLAGAACSALSLSRSHAQPFSGISDYARMYGPVRSDVYPIPGIDLSKIKPGFLRKLVPYDTVEAPGTIVIDPRARYLYHVQGDGTAVRYGVGVGRTGFSWSGVATIEDKQEWPDWYPPKEMLGRQPGLMEQMADLPGGTGMPGGPGNPLGARAMYLWQGKKDTLYRIHGTFEPWTIGTNVSSGCIRMINQDAMDLYENTPVGTKVVVLSGSPATRAKREGAARSGRGGLEVGL